MLDKAALATLSISGFIRNMSCDLTAAADSTCWKVGEINSCYQACVDKAARYGFTYSPSYDRNVTENLKQSFCYTDSINCRYMDSYYCEGIYNFRTCDQNLTRFIKCAEQVQLARGCSLVTNCFASQRIVQSMIFISVMYCAMVNVSELISAHALEPAYTALQYCETTIYSQCLASFAEGLGVFSKYIFNSISCEEYSRAIACIGSTTNRTFSLPSGLNVTAPCRLLPNPAVALQSIMDRVQAMAPTRCQSGASGEGQSTPVETGAGASAAAANSTYGACQSSLGLPINFASGAKLLQLPGKTASSGSTLAVSLRESTRLIAIVSLLLLTSSEQFGFAILGNIWMCN